MRKHMDWNKIIILLILSLLITGCTKVDTKLYDSFLAAYDNAGSYISYHNDSNSKLIIDDYNIELSTTTSTDFENGNVKIDTLQEHNGQKFSSTINIEDGNIYYDLDDIKTYTSFDTEMKNMNDIKFSKEDVKSASQRDGKLVFVMSDDYCTNILNMNAVDSIAKINEYKNEMIIEIKDNQLLSQTFTLDFNVNFIDDENINGSYKFTSLYTNIGNTHVDEVENKELYISEDKMYNTTLEEFKKALLDTLSYEINEFGNYTTTFNNNETYTFDFNNHIFTYVYANTSYTYDWESDKAVYEGCTIDFSKDEHLGSCNENKIKDLEELKLNYLTELALCGFSKMPLE